MIIGGSEGQARVGIHSQGARIRGKGEIGWWCGGASWG